MLVLTIVLSAFVVLLAYCYWLQNGTRYAKLVNKFPMVKCFIPIIGNVFAVRHHPDYLYVDSRRILESFKETFAAWGGISAFLHIVTVEDAQIILSSTKNIDKEFIYKMMQPWLNTGLLTSTGRKWHIRRKLLTPSFHYQILQEFVNIFGEHGQNLIKKLKGMEHEDKINIMPLISKLTLATICETSMGIKIDESNELMLSYYDALHSFGKIIVQRIFSPWYYSDFVYNLSPLGRKGQKAINFMHKFTKNVIKRREETFQMSDFADFEMNNRITSKKRLAMLDLLIYAKRMKEIDDEGIREEVETFIFEGHDTTYVGLTFTLFLLATHRDIQKKIIEELDQIFGESNRNATFEDLQSMKYLECCIKESLRLYPSVPVISRKINEEVPLTHHTAPSGINVFVHIFHIHRDPRHFPDPLKFNPDRFLPENSKGRHPFVYIPFSAGPRNCIGQKFAMLEMKSVISAVLRNFHIEAMNSINDLEFVYDFVLRTKGPMNIKFIPRT